jgi:hypothetical protein
LRIFKSRRNGNFPRTLRVMAARPGIRRYITEKNGDVIITCHPDGDLESRSVFHLVAQQGSRKTED